MLEENETAAAEGAAGEDGDSPDAAANIWNMLGAKLLAGQQARAKFWSTAMWPYGSEFSYDTTGQEEVVVWLLYFGYDTAAKRTVDHILSYVPFQWIIAISVPAARHPFTEYTIGCLDRYMRSLPNWCYMGAPTSFYILK